MKNAYKIISLVFVGAAVLLTSCYKKFDPASYQPLLTIGGYSSTSEIGQGHLVAYFPFDGDVKDQISGSSGTAVGTSFANGFKGQALQGALDGYVLFDPGPSITGMSSFTITYWVNSPVNTNGIVGLVNLSNTQKFWGNIDMFFENGSTQDAASFRAHITNGGAESWVSKDGIPGVFGNWTSFALSYDAASSTFALYVNGSPVYSNTATGFGPIQFTNSGPMVFGTVQFQTTPSLTSATGSQGWASFLTGLLDEVRIYDTALPASDINALVKLEGRGK